MNSNEFVEHVKSLELPSGSLTFESLIGWTGQFAEVVNMARSVRPFKPVEVVARRDEYVELADNPDDLPVSVKDFDAARDLSQEDIAEYGDSCRQDSKGNLYIERGNQ